MLICSDSMHACMHAMPELIHDIDFVSTNIVFSWHNTMIVFTFIRREMSDLRYFVLLLMMSLLMTEAGNKSCFCTLYMQKTLLCQP